MFVGRTVPMTAPCREMRQVVTSAVKKKHRWGECPRDRKESTHVEDRGRREVRAGRAGQRGGDEMRLCGGGAGWSGLYFVEEEIKGQSSSEAVPWGVQLTGVGLESDLDPGISTCFPDPSGLSPPFRGPMTQAGDPIAASDTGFQRPRVPRGRGRHMGGLSPGLAVSPPPYPAPKGWLASAAPWLPPWRGHANTPRITWRLQPGPNLRFCKQVHQIVN